MNHLSLSYLAIIVSSVDQSIALIHFENPPVLISVSPEV
jgi:hypothetical protein